MIIPDAMTNAEIAEYLGEFCYGIPASLAQRAAQLFIEEVVLPENVDSYDADQMALFILDFLNKKNLKTYLP